MDDFHYEIKKLTRIRKAIPKPDENTLMQKVITEDVAIVVDTKHLKTIEGTIMVCAWTINNLMVNMSFIQKKELNLQMETKFGKYLMMGLKD